MQQVYKESNGIQGEQGIQGETGATGNGISTIAKTSTNGLVDTYTITYTNGNTTTFNVTNGKGISSIVKTGSAGLVDVYRVTFNDGTYFDYTVTNGQNGEVTTEELQDVYEQMSSELEDSTATGTEIDTTGGAYWGAKLKLSGNTEQATNIITYTCNGTETGDYYFVYNSTNYQFTMPTVSSGDVIYFNTDTLKLYLSNTEIITTTASTGTLLTMNNTPNPNYEQPIKVVTGDNEIIISTRNFWSFGIAKLGHCSLTDGKWVEPHDAYTFFFPTNILPDNITFNITGGNRSNVSYWNNLPNINDIAESYSRTSYATLPRSVTVNKNYKYLAIQVTYGVSLSALSNGQLEEGNSLSTYSVSEHQTYPITLPEGMELCKIGNYQDKIFHNIPSSPYYDSSLINGSWYMRKECTKNIITSISSLYTSVGSGYIGAQKDISDLKSNSRTNGYCKQLIPINSTFNVAQECICFGAGNKYLYIVLKDSRINDPTVANWNSYLANNPLEIYYPLETPTTTPITDTTLVQQLNDLYDKLKTYQGVTHITQSNAEIPFILKLNYKKSNILRIQALEQAILSQGANV